MARRIEQNTITLGPGKRTWRQLLPTCGCELESLKARALEAKPEGVDVLRFCWWLEAELTGDDRGAPRGLPTLAKYRRLLLELRAGETPVVHLEGCDGNLTEPHLVGDAVNSPVGYRAA